MAAKTIKGITVQIGGDTTGLGKALKEVEKQSSGLSSNLKAVNKALKLDPTNTELLAEKQKILAESVEATKEKLETLKSVQDQIRQQYEAGDIDRGAYLDFQKELAYTEDQLERLEREQKDFGSTVKQVMKEAGKEVSEFGDKLKKAGDNISDVGEKFLPVTAAITAAGAYSVSAGSDMIESQNKVEVAFGKSSDKVKQFAETTLDSYGIAKGTSLDMAALFGDMATSMELPTDAAAEMSISLVGLAGDLASFKNLELEEASSALKGIFTGETEALKNLGIVMTQDNLLRFAMQQGMLDTAKSAQQLAKEQLALEKAQVAYTNAVAKHGEGSLEARDAALKMADAEEKLSASTKASLDSLSAAEMVQLRYAYVLNATQNAQGDFARTSDGAANSMRVASEAVKELAADFGVLMAPYVAEAAQMLSELIKRFIALPEETKKNILVIAALVAAIGPLLIIVGKVSSGIGSIISVSGTLISGIGGATTAFAGLGGAMGALPVLGIIAAIAAIVASIIWLKNHSEEIAIIWKESWNSMIETWKKGNETMVTETHAAHVEQVTATQSFWANIRDTYRSGNEAIVTETHAAHVEQVTSLQSFWSNLTSLYQTGNETIVTQTHAAHVAQVEAWQSFISNILNKITSWGQSMKSKASTAIENARSAISSGLERIRSLFNFEWSLPHIKLPHFYVSGSFSLNPPQVPSFGVQWYAKGAILDGAQIFGRLGNMLLGGGEAGKEAVLPLSSFYSELRSILGSYMRSPADSGDMTKLFNKLDGIYEKLGRLQVVLDTGVLVGETIDRFDAAFAEKQMLDARGV